MKANELRIGNKILYNTEGVIWEVLTVTWEDIKECLDDYKEFNEKHIYR